MVKVGLYVKILFLVIGLVIVVVAIRSTTKDKVEGVFQALGFEPGTSSPKLVTGESRRNLCHNRVHAVRFPDGRSIVERKNGLKLDWVSEESAQTSGSDYGPGPGQLPASRSLSYLEIEKWFSLHCQYTARAAGPETGTEEPLEPSNEPKKYVRFDFIDGSQLELYRSGQILSSLSHPKDRFVSEDLVQALEELRALAAFPVDSTGR